MGKKWAKNERKYQKMSEKAQNHTKKSKIMTEKAQNTQFQNTQFHPKTPIFIVKTP
jgi:hypothetical protein